MKYSDCYVGQVVLFEFNKTVWTAQIQSKRDIYNELRVSVVYFQSTNNPDWMRDYMEIETELLTSVPCTYKNKDIQKP